MQQIKVGKYTLESLTTGMYENPEIIYREYIQNSVDSIEEAVKNNILKIEESRINIILSEMENKIIISDNGMGISENNAFYVLTDIGNSSKKYENNRGFRGIGRLGGLSFCEKLRFISKYKGEENESLLEYDCVKLKRLLVPGENDHYDLENVLREVVTFEKRGAKKIEDHYFIVELEGIDIFTDLLDIDKMKSYIKQTCPLPYKRFVYKKDIHDLFKNNNRELLEFNIYMGSDKENLEQLYKPVKYNFKSNVKSKNYDFINEIKTIQIYDQGELLAIGWYGKCNYYGTIIDKEIAGIRIRKGNILVKSSRIINQVFKEPRFNGWVQGEVFILSDKIIPNARRDDFEPNITYYNLIKGLEKKLGEQIQAEIRQESRFRNSNIKKTITDINISMNKSKELEGKGFAYKGQKEKSLQELNKKKQNLEKAKPQNTKEDNLKRETLDKVEKTIEIIEKSNNYKTNKLKGVISKKERKILDNVSESMLNILLKYLSDEEQVNKIIDEVIESVESALLGRDKK